MAKTNRKHNVPWYRSIKLSHKEIIVGIVCLECGEIIGTNDRRTKYHTECFKKHRADRQWKNTPILSYSEKYCIDCGKIMDESKWSRPQSIRCDWCQFLYSKEYSSKRHYYERKSIEATVAVTCIICNKLVLTNHKSSMYCKDCIKAKANRYATNKNKKLTRNEKSKKGREYYLKLNKKLYGDEVIERLGTFDTSPRRGDVSKIKREKNGKPDWEREQRDINRLKKKTLSKKKYKRHYIMTDGDRIRNTVKKRDGLYIDD
jgi:hypothetical protein